MSCLERSPTGINDGNNNNNNNMIPVLPDLTRTPVTELSPDAYISRGAEGVNFYGYVSARAE